MGEATWYDFTKAILEFSGKQQQVELKKSNNYKTIAARPDYSILDKNKISTTFKKPIPFWEESLKRLIETEDL